MRFFCFLFLLFPLFSDEAPISQEAKSFNENLLGLRETIKEKYEKAQTLYFEKGDGPELVTLFNEIKSLKEKVIAQEKSFKKKAQSEDADEGIAFWDLGETTIGALLMEYGSLDYLYIMPFEIGSLKINLFSSTPLPRESWDQFLEMILLENGIGIKKSGVFLKQLYILKHDPSHVEAVLDKAHDLEKFDSNARIFFVFSPPAEQIRAILSFFERFSDPKSMILQIIGSKIVIIAQQGGVKRLLQLYDAVFTQGQDKMVRVITLKKATAQDAEKILKGFFSEAAMRSRPNFYSSIMEELQLFPIAESNAVVIVGSQDMVEKAVEVLKDLEEGLQESSDSMVTWYSCKHSEPEDLAAILENVYASLCKADLDDLKKQAKGKVVEAAIQNSPRDSFNPTLPVSPPKVGFGAAPDLTPKNFGNFIVYPKSGLILMVIRRADYEKITALLKKLDVPKKMVRIEVLLAEKRIQEHKQTGINLLQIGNGKKISGKSVSFDTAEDAKNKGLLSVLLGHHKGFKPSFDLAMSFLMSKDDIRVKACPSILAVNHTPASISVVEELSINNGAVQSDRSSGLVVEKSYTRAQYGIVMVITPTVHEIDEEEGKKGYMTLHTNVHFDTTEMSSNDRPNVTRRHIENEVQIMDGETVILGGLRRSSNEDSREKIPFLGEIPGFGKLFGTTKMNDNSAEMFIFITPHIIEDEKAEKRKMEEAQRLSRPGDTSEFLQKLYDAREKEKKKIFSDSLRLLWDGA